MNQILKIVSLAALVILSGCGNLSPRHEQRIDNTNGKIDEIKSNQNGLMAEIGNLKNQTEIQNSQLDRIQQGMLNMQSNNENSGVQILSGPGGIVVALVAVIGSIVLVLHYRSQAKLHEKTANILTERIVNRDDPDLEEAVFQSAMYTNVEENVLSLIKKHKSLRDGQGLTS